jgi:hypothetical protein
MANPQQPDKPDPAALGDTRGLVPEPHREEDPTEPTPPAAPAKAADVLARVTGAAETKAPGGDPEDNDGDGT